MGIDGAEIKRLKAKKEMSTNLLSINDQDTTSHIEPTPPDSQVTTERKKSTIDRLRPFVFAVVVPFILILMVIRYDHDNDKTPPPPTTNNPEYTPSLSAASVALSSAGYAEAAAAVINIQFGNICRAEVSGIFSKTFKIDWTANTTKLHAVMVLGEIGKTKEKLYEDGVRYFQFPNDSGTYNVIDWKTGEKESISDRAAYSFR